VFAGGTIREGRCHADPTDIPMNRLRKSMRRIRRMAMLSAASAAVSYFADPTNGPARRRRVTTQLRQWRAQLPGDRADPPRITSVDDQLAAASGQSTLLSPETAQQ
jgi:hypothetical protein